MKQSIQTNGHTFLIIEIVRRIFSDFKMPPRFGEGMKTNQ